MRFRYLAVVIAAGAAAAAARAATADIDLVGKQFSKTSMTLKVGDHIRIRNRDSVAHNINVIDPGNTASKMGLQKAGETVDLSFDKEGRFTVRCGIHPRMHMTVSVAGS